MDFTEFVLSHLPPAPARVLEVGCGAGNLTRAIAAAGYDALGIDPAAPDGPLFRRVKLADLEEEAGFDAVVAVGTLHHVTDLDVALDRIAALLPPGGVLLVDELAWDLFDRTTADWLWGQRRILAATRGEGAPSSVSDLLADWEAEHVGLHGYRRLRAELDRRFETRHFSWEPYFHRHLDGVASEELERALIESGAIQAVGFRYVGTPSRG
jgi:SAM-dependent methyltransferase